VGDLNFVEIRDKYPIADVASMLGLQLVEAESPHGLQLVGQCPMSKQKNATAFKLTPDKNRFICFCTQCKAREDGKRGGDLIEMVMRVRGIENKREAAQLVVNHFEGAGKADDNAPPKQEVSTGRKPSSFDPLAYQAKLDPYHESLIYDGEVVKMLGGGVSKSPTHRGLLALPIYALDGSIKAFVGVSPDHATDEVALPKDYTPPFFMGVQKVRPPHLIVARSLHDWLVDYEGGLDGVIALLAPITPDVLTSLRALMLEAKCETMEIL
jgi:hypothetical protein